jgi:hypothetical protein
MTGRYLAGILLLAAAAWGCLRAARGSLPPARSEGLLLGLGLATVGAVSWILAASWTIGRGHQAFMGAQVLGILGRLVVYGAALIYVALRTTIDPVYLAGSLLGFHVVYMVLEIRFAMKGLRQAGHGTSGGSRHGG